MQALVAACHVDCGRVVLLVCGLDSAPLNTPAKYVAAILHLPHLSAVALARPSANYANYAISISPEGYGLLRVVAYIKCLRPCDQTILFVCFKATKTKTQNAIRGVPG